MSKNTRVLQRYLDSTKGIRLSGFFALLFYSITWYIESAQLPIQIKYIINAIFSQDFVLAEYHVYLYGIITVFLFITGRIGDLNVVIFECTHAMNLRINGYKEIIRQELEFFEKTYVGVIVGKIKRFVGSAEPLMDELCYNYSVVAIQVFIIFTIINNLSFYFTFLYAPWLLIYLLFIFATFQKRNDYDKKEAEADSRFTATLSDSLVNIVSVKSCGQEDHEKTKINKAAKESYLALKASYN